MGDVDVFATQDHIVLQKGNNSLWCSRKNGDLTPKTGKGHEHEAGYPKLRRWGLILRFVNILVRIGEIKFEQNVVKLDTPCKCLVGKLKLLSGSLN